MFPFVSSFLINPLHNCHLSFSKSDFGEIWPKAGEAKKWFLSSLLSLNSSLQTTYEWFACLTHSFFPRTNFHNFIIKGSFCVVAFCPYAIFFLQRPASDRFERPPIRGNYGFAKLPPLSLATFSNVWVSLIVRQVSHGWNIEQFNRKHKGWLSFKYPEIAFWGPAQKVTVFTICPKILIFFPQYRGSLFQ